MIAIENVTIRFPGGFVGLHPTSLEFKKGSFNVLLGSSGAGKSTLLRCLNFLNVPAAGSVRVDGLGEIPARGRLLRRHRRNTAMIFQQHQLIERHTALQNVLAGRIGDYNSFRTLLPLPRKDQIIALECLDRVGLLHKALERVDNLSGGQQQRVGIARGLAQMPTLLLADEPVASLDPASSEKILSLLYSICKADGLTAIVSLHQVELAQGFAERIIGLANGRVVFDGRGADLTPEVITALYRNKPFPVPASEAEKKEAKWSLGATLIETANS